MWQNYSCNILHMTTKNFLDKNFMSQHFSLISDVQWVTNKFDSASIGFI
jgi:hypothetical protein